MSRTDKDAPYWVRAFRDGRISHDHFYYNMGHRFIDVTCKRRVLNEDGTPKVKTVMRDVLLGYQIFSNYLDYLYRRNGTFVENNAKGKSHLNLLRFQNPDEFYMSRCYGKKAFEFPVFEDVVTGHYVEPENCSDELVIKEAQHHTSKRKHGENVTMCEHSMPSWTYRREYMSPTKFQRRKYHSEGRRIERNRLTNLAKDYNSGEDLFEYDTTEFETRTKMHTDWWD